MRRYAMLCDAIATKLNVTAMQFTFSKRIYLYYIIQFYKWEMRIQPRV